MHACMLYGREADTDSGAGVPALAGDEGGKSDWQGLVSFPAGRNPLVLVLEDIASNPTNPPVLLFLLGGGNMYHQIIKSRSPALAGRALESDLKQPNREASCARLPSSASVYLSLEGSKGKKEKENKHANFNLQARQTRERGI